MHPCTNWIWTPDDDGLRNLTICARRQFDLEESPREAHLEISADTHYVLYINGQRVGQGPCRGWNHLKPFDSYEVSRYLQAGQNVIAVQVVRWGIKNGQYLGGPGGLIAQLVIGDAAEPTVATDSSWRVAINPAYNRNVFRMAMALGFSEEYDARKELGEWTQPEFDDSQWSAANVLGPEGTEPWLSMQQRQIPFLTEEPVYPKRVFDFRAVTPPEVVVTFDIHDAICEPQGADKPCECGVMVSEIMCERTGEITMIRMNATWDLDQFGLMRINGVDTAFDADRATFPVHAGSNLMVVAVNRVGQSAPSWFFDSAMNIRLRTPVGDSAGPAAVYACASIDEPVVKGCWEACSVTELAEWLPSLRPIRPDEQYKDIFALSNLRKELQNISTSATSPHALCSANSEYTVIESASEGDTEFVMDFGEEMVGYIDFDIDAPEGAIVDFNCFEAMIDGEWKWTDNLRNTIRYTAKEGWQNFHSVVRRGFRYVQVTVRNAKRPVRIREILCLVNTYPVQNHGAFRCSDALLNNIWDLGRRTTRMCMDDTFVDCPTYEQSFWVGDARNESLASYAAFGDTALTRHCLELAAQSLWRSPMPEPVIPAEYGTTLIPNWSLFWVLSCEEYFRYTGDKSFARQIRPAILQTCRHFTEHRNPLGLFQCKGWNFIDWANVDSSQGGMNTHENVMAAEALRRAAVLMDAAGATEGDSLREEAELFFQAINSHLWDEENHAYIDSIHPDGERSKVLSQQTQTIAYLFGAVPEDRVKWVDRRILDVPDGWVKIGSPWMTWFSLDALAKKGDQAAALELIREKWGEMLEMDATTCWETFGSWGSGRWSPTRSWCHAWSAAPTYFLSTHQLGVSVLEPGGSKLMIAPKPCGLTWAWGRVPTSQGVVSVSWKIVDDVFKLSVILPEGVDCEVIAPDECPTSEVQIKNSSHLTSPTGSMKT